MQDSEGRFILFQNSENTPFLESYHSCSVRDSPDLETFQAVFRFEIQLSTQLYVDVLIMASANSPHHQTRKGARC